MCDLSCVAKGATASIANRAAKAMRAGPFMGARIATQKQPNSSKMPSLASASVDSRTERRLQRRKQAPKCNSKKERKRLQTKQEDPEEDDVTLLEEVGEVIKPAELSTVESGLGTEDEPVTIVEMDYSPRYPSKKRLRLQTENSVFSTPESSQEVTQLESECAKFQKLHAETCRQLKETEKRMGEYRTRTMETLRCPLCLELMHQPVSIGPCAHKFCGACMTQLVQCPLAENQEILCPNCKDPIKWINRDFTTIEIIEGFLQMFPDLKPTEEVLSAHNQFESQSYRITYAAE